MNLNYKFYDADDIPWFNYKIHLDKIVNNSLIEKLNLIANTIQQEIGQFLNHPYTINVNAFNTKNELIQEFLFRNPTSELRPHFFHSLSGSLFFSIPDVSLKIVAHELTHVILSKTNPKLRKYCRECIVQDVYKNIWNWLDRRKK